MKKSVFLLLLVGLLMLNNIKAQQSEQNSVNLPKGFTAQLDVVYTTVNNWDGKMDIYLPPKEERTTPIVINIHGGGWNKGNKESQTGFASFFKKGYAVANISYRLVDKGTAPAAIEDVRCALIYILKNAEELNINPDKIVIMGGSAGGHLALMGGLVENNSFNTNCKYDKPVKVAAIIDKYGPTNLVSVAKWPSASNWLGNKRDNEEFVKSVSPLFHVTKNSPPVFIVHGTADNVVPINQSEQLYEKLNLEGVKNKFIIIENGGHGKFTEEEKSYISKEMWSFLTSLGL